MFYNALLASNNAIFTLSHTNLGTRLQNISGTAHLYKYVSNTRSKTPQKLENL